ncbi:hypothetical protein [Hymenobacter sp. BRD67]|uniref:hypothetical protein n=1 Tax=Hymenobacter sp. BRD67 TaxID=2675877 RepID=UPI00156632D5|nr:hypothetical protein [Hymenobacter sp. BRD67]QKG53856.1 hypothetical protein GKZ67_16185 [Hymenobacter sp. BRD67]
MTLSTILCPLDFSAASAALVAYAAALAVGTGPSCACCTCRSPPRRARPLRPKLR